MTGKRYFVRAIGKELDEDGEPKSFEEAVEELKRIYSDCKHGHEDDDCYDEACLEICAEEQLGKESCQMTITDSESNYYQCAYILPVNEAGGTAYILEEIQRASEAAATYANEYEYRMESMQDVYDELQYIRELAQSLEQMIKSTDFRTNELPTDSADKSRIYEMYLKQARIAQRSGPVQKDMTIQLVNDAIGVRSMSKFAAELGVNVSSISRILSGKVQEISSELLAKIATYADPDSGVTLEKLMDAQGLHARADTSASPTRPDVKEQKKGGSAANQLIDLRIVVDTGMITDVCVDARLESAIDVTIIDLDTTDPDEQKAANDALDELRKELENGTMRQEY